MVKQSIARACIGGSLSIEESLDNEVLQSRKTKPICKHPLVDGVPILHAGIFVIAHFLSKSPATELEGLNLLRVEQMKAFL